MKMRITLLIMLSFAALLGADPQPAATTDPTVKPAWASAMDRADSRLKLGDWDGAIAEFTHAIEIDSQNADAYIQRGIAKIGQSEEKQDKGELEEGGLSHLSMSPMPLWPGHPA
jgi:hypothetical protein